MYRSIFNRIIQNYSLFFISITICVAYFLYAFAEYSLIRSYIFSYLIITVGVRSIIAFMSNAYAPVARYIAKQYNWPIDCSLQRDVAAADGGFGVMGILCYWFSGEFWLATMLGYTFCWIFTETIGILKIIKRYVTGTEPEKEISVFLFVGMCADLFFVIFTFTIFMVYYM